MNKFSVGDFVTHSKMPEWGIGKITSIQNDYIEIDFPLYKKAFFSKKMTEESIEKEKKCNGYSFWKKERKKEYMDEIKRNQKEEISKKFHEMWKKTNSQEKKYYSECQTGRFVEIGGRVGIIALKRAQENTITPKILVLFLTKPRFKKTNKKVNFYRSPSGFSDRNEKTKLNHYLFMFRRGKRNLKSYSWRVSARSHRVTHCYNCKKNLDNKVHIECSECGWIICPRCGACGHGFS